MVRTPQHKLVDGYEVIDDDTNRVLFVFTSQSRADRKALALCLAGKVARVESHWYCCDYFSKEGTEL